MVTKEYYDGLIRKWKLEYQKYSGQLNVYRLRPKPGNQYHATFWIRVSFDTVTIRYGQELDYFLPLIVDYIINELKYNNIVTRKHTAW